MQEWGGMTRVQSVHSAIITLHWPMVSQVVQAVPPLVNMLQHVCLLCLGGDKISRASLF